MYKNYSDIENFENKSRMLVSRLMDAKESGSNKPVNIKEICNSIGIIDSEIEDMIYHLERGQVIETAGDKNLGNLTLYGELLYHGKIKTGYAPL